MYNSFTMSLLLKTSKAVNKIYKHSLISKLFSSIKKRFNRTYLNSNFYIFNKNIKTVFKESFLFKIVNYIFYFLDTILNSLYNFRKRLTKGSKISEGFRFYTLDEISGLRLFYEVFILLGIFILMGNIFGVSLIPPVGSILLIIIGAIGILINGRELDIIFGSTVFNFFYDLFKLDEGGENWW